MRLLALHIDRLPGIDPGFKVEDIQPGINVVIGPNASGKSSLLRALRAALYQEEGRRQGVVVSARFEDARGELEVQRVGDDLQWRRDGAKCEAPPLPEHRLLPCYTLHVEDLLAANADTEQDIAARLARELAGGYDLRAVREAPPFALSARHGKTETDTLNLADQRLQDALREQRQLQQDETGLQALRTRQAEARAAADQQSRQETALKLLEAGRRLRELEQKRDTFPACMDNLHGDERARLNKLEQRLAGQEQELAETREALKDAEDEVLASKLDDTSLTASALQDWRSQLRELHSLESALERLREDLSKATAARDSATEALGGDESIPPALTPAAIREVETRLERRHALLPVLEQLRREIARLSPATAEGRDEDQLRRARDALLLWLSSPAPVGQGVLRFLAATVLLGAAALGIGAAAYALHWSLLLLLLPAAWGGWALLRAPVGTGRREEARARHRESGGPEPDAWGEVQVRACLDELNRQLVTLERDKLAREQGIKFERELKDCQDEVDELEASLAEHACRAGFDSRGLGLSLDRWLHLVAAYDKAATQCRALEDALQDKNAAYLASRQALLDFLRAHDEAPDLTPERITAAALEARLVQLEERLGRRDNARRAGDQARGRIDRCELARKGTLEEISALYQEAGLEKDDKESLDERLRRLQDWRDLRKTLGEEGLYRDRLRAELDGEEDLLARVETGDEAGLQRDLETLRERAGEYVELTQEIEGIKARLDQAGRTRRLEAARNEFQQANEALRERLDEALLAEAGHCLLDEVAAEYQRESQPRALRRAHDWFLKFTGYQYELSFEPEEARFEARDTRSGLVLGLSELSSGTRMQLLLALRIAFALDAEQGCEALPLFLDEALTTADPDRFAAAVESLRVLAEEEGRQIFYLSAQPEDLRYWRAAQGSPHCIDLGDIRRGQQAVPEAEDLAPPSLVDLPPPDGLKPEDYALRLKVPFLDPWRESGEMHLFHLLRDHLALLHRLLSVNIVYLGQLLPLLSAGEVEMLLSPDQRLLLRARAAAATVWLEGWRQGRGRPVDRPALEASGAVSAAFVDAVADLCDELQGDGRALIQQLEAGAVKRFRSNFRENLDAWLREQGYIDERDALAPPLLQLRVAAALRACLPDNDMAAAEAAALVRHLTAGMASRTYLSEMEAQAIL